MIFAFSCHKKIGFVEDHRLALVMKIAIAWMVFVEVNDPGTAFAQDLVGILALEIEKAAVAKSGMRDPVPVPIRGLIEFSHIDEGGEDLDGEAQCAGLHEIDQIRIRDLPFGNDFLEGKMALYKTQHGRPVQYFVHYMF